jgi:peptidyl-prolyl cis-trans isomerase D
MSIIQQIREKYAALVIGLIALSLIGFILMDAGRQGSGGVTPSDAIGVVNGTNISYEQFLDRTKMTEQMYEMNGRVVDENTRQQIYTQAWETMVESELLKQQYTKLGIQVTDKEFNDILFGDNPAPFLQQEFTDPNTGMFDAAAAKNAIAQIKKSKNNPNRDMIEKFYLEPTLDQALRTKYTSLLQNSAYVPKWMVEKTMADNNAIAIFKYVQVPYASISDSALKVSDEAINNYVKAHSTEFKQEFASRSIAYVSFPFPPSADDSADALRTLQSLKAEFETTTDAGAFVTRNASSLPFFDGYNSKARIQIPNKDSIIAAGAGKVYGPYMDGRSYVMSRVLDVKTLPDSVKARHILVGTIDPRTQQPKLDDASAKRKIDSIQGLLKSGQPFEILALQFSDDEGSKMKGGDLGYFASGTMVKEFNDFCFNGKTGEQGIVKTQFGYHLIQVLDQKDFAPSYKIAYMAKSIEASQNTINEANSKASIFAGNSRSLKAVEENVKKNNYTKLVGTDIKENDYNIAGVGVNRKLVRDIFEKGIGDVLEPVELDGQFLVVAITGEEKSGLMSAAKARPQVESNIRNEEKAKLIAAKIGKPASLEAVATAQNVTVQNADSVSFVSPMVPGAGYEPKVGGFAFNKSGIGKISEPIAGSGGVFVVLNGSIGARADAGTTMEDMQKNLVSQQKNTVMYGSSQALKKAASIKDKRSKFL